MKLIDLIPYLKSSERLDELYKTYKLNIESEAILIYMKGGLFIESEIVLFELEETGDLLKYKKDGIEYEQLFPVFLAIELIEDLSVKEMDDLNLALRLLKYGIYDA